jgi:hypothetical protein
MNQEQAKGKWERFGGFWEKIHYGIGAAALTGSVAFPEAAPFLATVGVIEVGHGLLWNYFKKIGKKKPAAAHGAT